MDDPLRVRGLQPLGDLHHHVQHALEAGALLADPPLERLSLERFHDDERTAGVLVNLVDRADVTVIQGRRGARFAAKALERDRIRGGAGRQELDRDLPPQAQVFGAIDDAHAARAELGGHAIVRDRLANHGGRRIHPERKVVPLVLVFERSWRRTELFLPIRLYGIVNPRLNRACVKAIVVVMAAAVPAAIAHVGDESLGSVAGPPRQENATA